MLQCDGSLIPASPTAYKLAAELVDLALIFNTGNDSGRAVFMRLNRNFKLGRILADNRPAPGFKLTVS